MPILVDKRSGQFLRKRSP